MTREALDRMLVPEALAGSSGGFRSRRVLMIGASIMADALGAGGLLRLPACYGKVVKITELEYKEQNADNPLQSMSFDA